MPSQTEIAQLHCIVFVQQDVVRFYISVNDPMLMQINENSDDLSDNPFSIDFTQNGFSPVNEIIESPLFDQFHNDA